MLKQAKKTSSKANLDKARTEKDDEFYTLLDDIIAEINQYRDYFEDKTVLLNCDDPKWSNFWRAMEQVFKHFKIEKVIATHYNPKLASYKLEMTRGKNGEPIISDRIPLKGHGDFRDDECRKLMRESDIVITNPPFSLFREFIQQIMEMQKKFIVVGNFMSCTYKDIYPLFMSNKIWLGQSRRGMKFKRSKVKDENYKGEYRGVNACWFTNLPNRRKNAVIKNDFTMDEGYYSYKTYENYPAIDVPFVDMIPDDYMGEMGVPITFMEKHNPKQFELVRFRKGLDGKDLWVKGNNSAAFRVIIKRRKNHAK